MHQYISFAFVAIAVVINLLILNYLLKLEKIGCECAMDWKRNYIMFFTVLSILYLMIAPVISESAMPFVQTVFIVLAVMNMVYVVQYVHRLKKTKCECSESIIREVMFIVAIINAILYTFLLTTLIFLLYTVTRAAKLIDAKASAVRKGKSDIVVKSVKKILKRK